MFTLRDLIGFEEVTSQSESQRADPRTRTILNYWEY